jgi:polyhydroxybutyrate depolymerase
MNMRPWRTPKPSYLRVSVLLGLLALFGGTAALRPGPGLTDDGHPGSNGPRYPVVVHRGASLAPPASSPRVPLVIALHASGGSPQGFEKVSGLDAVADEHGFVVAYLSAPTPTAPAWRASDMPSNLAYVSNEIRLLEADQNIDPGRVYVTGFSAGATMAFFVGCQLSKQVDGIAVVSGAMRFTDICKLAHPVSQLLVIGTRDGIPINGSPVLLSADQVAARWRTLNSCAASSDQTHAGPVTETVWSACDDGSAAALDVVEGGTHIWPGTTAATGSDAKFNAAEAVWSFFATYPGATSAQAPSASLSHVAVHRTGSTRTLALRFDLREAHVNLLATLRRSGRVTLSRRVSLTRPTQSSAVLPLPKKATGGRYSLTLALSDAYGRRASLVRAVTVPRASR